MPLILAHPENLTAPGADVPLSEEELEGAHYTYLIDGLLSHAAM